LHGRHAVSVFIGIVRHESYVTVIEGEFLCVGGVEECLGDERDVKVNRKLIAEVVNDGGDGA
jgi:hypothetical protein